MARALRRPSKVRWFYAGKHYGVRQIKKRSGGVAWAVATMGTADTIAQYRSRTGAVHICELANKAGSWSAARPEIRRYEKACRDAGILLGDV
jgi:hypothetical protein